MAVVTVVAVVVVTVVVVVMVVMVVVVVVVVMVVMVVDLRGMGMIALLGGCGSACARRTHRSVRTVLWPPCCLTRWPMQSRWRWLCRRRRHHNRCQRLAWQWQRQLWQRRRMVWGFNWLRPS